MHLQLIRLSDVLQLLNHNSSVIKSDHHLPLNTLTNSLASLISLPLEAASGSLDSIPQPIKLLAQYGFSGVLPGTWKVNVM